MPLPSPPPSRPPPPSNVSFGERGAAWGRGEREKTMMTTQPPWRRTGPTPERGARGRSAPPLGPRHRRVVGGGGEDAGAAPLDRRRSNPPTGAVAVATPPPLRLAPAPSSCRSALCGWKRKRGRERGEERGK
ncbi:Os09g0279800 [Oryza sativa Japonica Group]|uniref:Os09g0279800 protein n=2 Tax=Oryza sativa subsp. japonica TaxID=39947 RepID=Q6H441_ORYSJ|nr:hypothetical protein EE612_046537 [Oryza sativa]BAD26508.1 unknown protein [Oryza sativa Japonica Group]BAF24676.1 Os09g0279800 [Oryza sativa Japonica Group]BAG98133.1 unnamed protein product [Oryza sativa Japonica Group]BAT07217.1 Os09g0279800 [Oryza sativa Japonica Group]|eukprot:NP_001062762.1 Os09g0279800 [Oryza sativa Japonica Group]